MKAAITAGIAALFLATGTTATHATWDICAVVLRTPDGFLNLREKPTMKSKVLVRLKPGQWFRGSNSNEGHSGWTQVEFIGDQEIFVGKRLFPKGWVGSRFIVHVRCDELDPTDD
jgi:hypothetical protein